MSAPPGMLRIGGVVSLLVAWGSQQRLRCPVCGHFTREAVAVKCLCGAVYRRIAQTSDYLVETLP